MLAYVGQRLYLRARIMLMSAHGDTSTDAEARYFALLRARTPSQRATILAGLVTSVRRLAEASERARRPGASRRELEARVAARLYGAAVAAKFFPDVHIG